MLPQPWYTRSLRVEWATVTVYSTIRVRPMSSLYRMCSTLQLKSYCVSGSSNTSTLTLEIDYSRQLNTKCVSWCTYKCLHQAAPTYLTKLCSPVSESANRGHLHTSIPLHMVTLLFLVRSCGTHSHCQLVTHHRH